LSFNLEDYMQHLSLSQMNHVSGGASFSEDITALAATAHLGFMSAQFSAGIASTCISTMTSSVGLGPLHSGSKLLGSLIGLATPFLIAAAVFEKHPEHLESLKETYAKYF
jgi:hypothetical protein